MYVCVPVWMRALVCVCAHLCVCGHTQTHTHPYMYVLAIYHTCRASSGIELGDHEASVKCNLPKSLVSIMNSASIF